MGHPAASVEHTDALDLDAIAGQLLAMSRVVKSPRRCESEGCGTLLSQYNDGKLCHACEEKQ